MLPPDPGAQSLAERHLIELATRPLEDAPAVRDEARGELMERLSRQPPYGREAAAEAAVARLAKTVPGPWRSKAIAIGVAWLVLAGLCIWQGYRFYAECRDAAEEWEQYTVRTIGPTPDDAPATSPSEYEARFDGHQSLPADYRAVWTSIDAGNGAWAWREAVAKAEDLRGNSRKGTPAGDLQMAEAWKLAEEAVRAPRFDIYGPERRIAGMAPMQEPATYVSLMTRISSRFSFSFNTDLRQAVEELFTARAALLEKEGDQEGLRSAIRDWERLCLRSAEEAAAPPELDTAADIVAAGEPLAMAAGRLGMKAEEERIRDHLNAVPHDSYHYSYGSMIGHTAPESGMMARNIFIDGKPPEPADYEPARMMEYALAERLSALLAAILLVLVLGVAWLESIRRGRRVNGLAAGLAPLFDGRDGLWLVGLGVIAPFAWYWGITRLTPLGCRDVGFFHYDYPPVLMQTLAGLLLLLVMTLQTGQWRIVRRTAVLGIGARRLWPGWLMAGLAAALIPMAGIGRWLPPYQIDDFFQIAGVSCGIPLLWLLWRAGALIFGPGSNALGGVMLARAVILPLALASALLLGSHELLLGAEKHWLAKDEITGWDRSRGITKQEARSADAARQRFREAFAEPDPAPPAK